MNRRRLHEILAPAEEGDRPSELVDLAIFVLIATDMAAFVIDSVPAAHGRFGPVLHFVESLILGLYVAEYALRLWACSGDPRYFGVVGKLRYALTPMALVDLVAILPVLRLVPGLAALFPAGLSSFRGFRLLRLAKLGRYVGPVRILVLASWRSRRELGVVGVFAGLVILIASTLMYQIEGAQNPGFDTIPGAIYWSIVTMTTVGFGDTVPLTVGGKVVASFLMLSGVGLFAVPAGILGSSLVEELRREAERRKVVRRRRRERAGELIEEKLEHGVEVECPHCARSFVPSGKDFQD